MRVVRLVMADGVILVALFEEPSFGLSAISALASASVPTASRTLGSQYGFSIAVARAMPYMCYCSTKSSDHGDFVIHDVITIAGLVLVNSITDDFLDVRTAHVLCLLHNRINTVLTNMLGLVPGTVAYMLDLSNSAILGVVC